MKTHRITTSNGTCNSGFRVYRLDSVVVSMSTARICFSVSSVNTTLPIILQNGACSSDNNLHCTYKRKFAAQTDELFVSAATNATLAVFFDVLENVSFHHLDLRRISLVCRVIPTCLSYKRIKIINWSASIIP
jgi:hypothetical protein